MNAEYVNVILSSVKSVLKSVCGENADVKKVEFITKEFDFHDFNIYIGVIYDIKCSIFLSGNDALGHYIASKMIMSECTEWSDIAISAVKELTNMMAGTCSIKFSQFDQNTDITVPTFENNKSRNNMEKITENDLIVRVPLALSEGRIFYVSIQFLGAY